MEGSLGIRDVGLRRPGFDAQVKGAPCSRDCFLEHRLVRRWNASLGRCQRNQGTVDGRWTDRGRWFDHVPASASSSRWTRHLHRPVQHGQAGYHEDHSNAGKFSSCEIQLPSSLITLRNGIFAKPIYRVIIAYIHLLLYLFYYIC